MLHLIVYPHYLYLFIFLYFWSKGAIELAILSEYYGREIAAYDVQTTRCDLYGQVCGLLMVLYLVADSLKVLSSLCLLILL